MPLDDTDTTIYCQECGSAWKKDDDVGMYYFASTTVPIGSYTSPMRIAISGEQMTFCPKCESDPLTAPYDKPAKGIQESPFYEGDSRMVGSEPDPNPGIDDGIPPTVTHDPDEYDA